MERFAAKDSREAVFLTSFIEDKSISSLVLSTHSITQKSRGTILNRGLSLSTDSENHQYLYADPNGNFSSTANGLVDDFSRLLNKVEDNGTFISTACDLGQGEFGKNTLKALDNMTEKRNITFYLNMHKGGQDSYTGLNSVYGLCIGGSLSAGVNANNKWIGYKSGRIFYVNDILINRETGDPIVFR